MGKRRLPFGYKMQQGEIILCEEECVWVSFIFHEYLQGASLKEITESMKAQGVPYDEGKLWNKNMVARILEDDRYTGRAPYSAIITSEQFQTVTEKRICRRTVVEKSAAQKTLRKLYGAKVTDGVEKQVLSLLNWLIRHPENIQVPTGPGCSHMDVTVVQKQLEDALAQQPIDEEMARKLILQRASAEYDAISSADYETERIRRLMENAEVCEELNDTLLQKCVAKVVMTGGKKVGLQLKNGQIIERSALQ